MHSFNGGRHILPEPERVQNVVTAIGIEDQSAAFEPVRPTRPPQDAPNVVIVVLDDLGFGTSSAFGGPAGSGTPASTSPRCAPPPGRRC
jgi:arylsulfatase